MGDKSSIESPDLKPLPTEGPNQTPQKTSDHRAASKEGIRDYSVQQVQRVLNKLNQDLLVLKMQANASIDKAIPGVGIQTSQQLNPNLRNKLRRSRIEFSSQVYLNDSQEQLYS